MKKEINITVGTIKLVPEILIYTISSEIWFKNFKNNELSLEYAKKFISFLHSQRILTTKVLYQRGSRFLQCIDPENIYQFFWKWSHND